MSYARRHSTNVCPGNRVRYTYYYGACVDAVAGESDTTNNCSASVGAIVQYSSASRLSRASRASWFVLPASWPLPGPRAWALCVSMKWRMACRNSVTVVNTPRRSARRCN